MSGPGSGDKAVVTVLVAVPPADAFDVFTREIDLWWRHGPKFRGKPEGVLQFEPKTGGRLFDALPDGRVIEIGRVTTWEPPSRLVFSWRGRNFAPGETTTVEVRFDPSPSGTRVTLEHSGFASLRPGHPVRHGLEGAAFSRTIGLWWGDLMTSLREHASRHRAPPDDGDKSAAPDRFQA